MKGLKIHFGRRLYIFLVLLSICSIGYGQKSADTLALLNEYQKVMSFTVQPYVYYTTLTKMESEPIITSQDTSVVYSVFYKNAANIFSGNKVEETYLQDSLLISINHSRKSIWIARVDTATKKNMEPGKEVLSRINEMIKNGFSVSKRKLPGDIAVLSFANKKELSPGAFIKTDVSLEYNEKTLLPANMHISIYAQDVATDEMLAQLKSDGTATKDLIKTIDGVKYLVRKQSITTTYSDIDTTVKSAAGMPVWTSVLQYNNRKDEFVPVAGKVSDYEITKTF